MVMVVKTTENSTAVESMTFDAFISEAPIGSVFEVKCQSQEYGLSPNSKKIRLFCNECDADQFFDVVKGHSDYLRMGEKQNVLPFRLSLECRNCRDYKKLFLLRFEFVRSFNDRGGCILELEKLVEYPTHYKAASNQELSLIGRSEREEFLKGLSCERDGLGAAAFLYYRRVVENRRNKIFDQIIKVLKNSSHSYDELIQELESAKSEGQFVKSIDKIKAAFPDSLLISGQNPLKLLYSALSEGIHELSDQECLEYAEDIRVVLLAMSERIEMLLAESKNINGAIARLTRRVNKT